MLEIARRVIWFEPPEKALADPVQFMAYALTYAVHEDMRIIRRYLSDDDLREALDCAPPGIIDRARGPTGTPRWAATPPRQCPCGGSGALMTSAWGDVDAGA